MNFNKKLSVLIIFFFFSSLTLCAPKAYGDVIHKNLAHIIRHGDKVMTESLKANLDKHDRWWKSLSGKQKKIARGVDKVEKEYKSNHNQIPIEYTPENVAEISNQVGVVNLLDAEVVEHRLKEHIEDYNNIIKAQGLSKAVDKSKAIINGSFD